MELPTIANTAISALTHPITTGVLGFSAGIVGRFFHDRFQRRDNAGAALSTIIRRRYFDSRHGTGQARLLNDKERHELSLIMSRKKFSSLCKADDAYAECHARNMGQHPSSTFDEPILLNHIEVEAAAQKVLGALPSL